MARWIADNSVVCREVHNTRKEVHNSISGSPVFNVRLEIPTNQLSTAITKLLGNPESWPHTTIFQNVKCIAAEVIPNPGRYSTDADAQIINPVNRTLVDLTYAPRHGVYLEDYTGDDVYWDDVLEPRIESKPIYHKSVIWGTTDPAGIPVEGQRNILHPDEAPQKYEPGEQLTHIIEGWTLARALDVQLLTSHIGTCNDRAYTSIPLGRTFDVGTLLLRNVITTKAMTFKSYRSGGGTASFILKIIYEYKAVGWERFYRIDPISNSSDYYYIRYNTAPWNRFQAFPIVTHDNWLRT